MFFICINVVLWIVESEGLLTRFWVLRTWGKIKGAFKMTITFPTSDWRFHQWLVCSAVIASTDRQGVLVFCFRFQKKKTSLFTIITWGLIASWFVRSSPGRVVLVPILTWDTVFCFWTRHLTLTVPFSAQVYKWVPANLMLGVFGGNPAID